VSSGNGGGGNALAAPTAVNPMPVLTTEVREALTASIREHGVICPVVKDQTGFVLDGNNRIAIAAELGIPCPEAPPHYCTSDQREILRIELNGARRQITASQWKPLVDHLRSLTTSDGHRYSDRAIAQAVGVSKSIVSRHKPVMSTVPSGTVASKAVGKDGKARNQSQQWTAMSRTLHLVKQSSSGLTAIDLLRDPVLQGFGEGTVRRVPGALRDQGLLEDSGIKRDRSTVWRSVANPVTPSPKPAAIKTVARKADKIVEELKNPKVREAVKRSVADDRDLREAGTALRAAEKELEAARLAREKEEADAERDRLKLIEAARRSADTSIKTWEKLANEVRVAWTIIAAYSKVIDELPAIHPAFERTLDRELDELRNQMDRLDRRRHPNGKSTPVQAGFIDV
jgi:hypothetical protein